MDIPKAARRPADGICLEIFDARIIPELSDRRIIIAQMIKLIKNFITGSISLLKGLIVTLKNIFAPTTTIQYPTQKLKMTERYRGLVDLRRDKCISCLQCVKICPTACLALTSKLTEEKKKALESFTYNMELCCFCGLCQQVCPTSAIYMNKIYEVTAYDRKKLYINLLDPEKYVAWTSAVPK
jgi:NADH-quinone oxidoreductase subunit I